MLNEDKHTKQAMDEVAGGKLETKGFAIEHRAGKHFDWTRVSRWNKEISFGSGSKVWNKHEAKGNVSCFLHL